MKNGFKGGDAELRFFELGFQSLSKSLFVLTLLAEKSVLCLEGVDDALELLDVGLFAFSRVLGRESVSGLTSFETSLALLVGGFPATTRVIGLGWRGSRGGRLLTVFIVDVLMVGVVDLSLLAARSRVKEEAVENLLDGSLCKTRGRCDGGW